MDDIVSHKMAADYKSYELRQVIRDLKDMADLPDSRKALQPYWEDLFKSAEALKDLLNNIPPWDDNV